MHIRLAVPNGKPSDSRERSSTRSQSRTGRLGNAHKALMFAMTLRAAAIEIAEKADASTATFDKLEEDKQLRLRLQRKDNSMSDL